MVEPTNDNIQAIMLSLMKETMQCWSLVNEEKEIFGYIITMIATEPITKERTLVIYSFFLYKSVEDISVWQKGMAALESFAKENNCKNINAYSANDKVVTLAKKLGFLKEYAFIIKEV
jgi:hypothetical protein